MLEEDLRGGNCLSCSWSQEVMKTSFSSTSWMILKSMLRVSLKEKCPREPHTPVDWHEKSQDGDRWV